MKSKHIVEKLVAALLFGIGNLYIMILVVKALL